MIIERIRHFTLSALVAIAGAAATPALAQDAPDALVKKVSDEVTELIRGDKAIQQGDAKRITEVIEVKIVPHFNVNRMTALAVGSNWRKATPAQQQALADEFKTLLVRTYSSGLSSYRDQKIEFKPLRAQPTDSDVVVRSEVKRSGGEPIAIDYSMEKTTGAWKVYDVAIAGVSLVTTYRDSFRDEIRQSGIDGLVKSLADKNRSLAGRRS